jgi:hypothetical protein
MSARREQISVTLEPDLRIFAEQVAAREDHPRRPNPPLDCGSGTPRGARSGSRRTTIGISSIPPGDDGGARSCPTHVAELIGQATQGL